MNRYMHLKVVMDNMSLHLDIVDYRLSKKLIESGETVKYNGKALDDHEIPVILNYPEDELQERVMLLSSNAYRTMDKKGRRQVILEAHRCYTIHCANGDKPEGREREWITAITGISDGTVKDVLAEINKKRCGWRFINIC